MKVHMAARFSTPTVIDSEYLVPWLPGIFNPQVNLPEHRYFGSPLKDNARFPFDFWADARRGDKPALERYGQLGFFSDNELRTPMAAHHHVRYYRDTLGSLLIQHGSYHWVSLEDQPSIPAGEVSLYRGIGQATRFRCLRFRPEELWPANGETLRKYLRIQADMLSDSILSFNTIHDRLKRGEAAGLRDGTWVGDELGTQAGLDIQSPAFASDLWHAAQQAYSLERVIGVGKVRSPPCRRQDASEQHPDHDVLRG